VDFPVRECVGTAARVMAPLAADKGLQLSVRVDDDVPECLHGDSHRLRQILLNLVGNALKFTERGSVTIHVSQGTEHASEPDASTATVQFAVADTGIGIPAAQQALIFDPFRQADGSVTRRFGGTGLGLSICSKLVGLMNGRIWLDSREGEGSTFFFTVSLPIGSTSHPAADPNFVLPRSTGRTLSILVAEDNPINQRLTQRLLEMRGHQVVIVANGEAAIEAWKRKHYDLIFMDVQMPGTDGLEATRRIRAQETPSASRIPIIAMTAHAIKGDREQCLAAGMDAYVSKPVQIAALNEALLRYELEPATPVRQQDAASNASSVAQQGPAYGSTRTPGSNSSS
jgi:CheY-like chemotaxis protein